MTRDPMFVLKYLTELEETADDILVDKQKIVDLDYRRNKNREAIRCLINESKKQHPSKASWMCFSNSFIKFPNENAKSLLEKEQEEIEKELVEIRKNLKPKVNKLRDLEGKPELQGFNLQPFTKEEMAAINLVLKGSS